MRRGSGGRPRSPHGSRRCTGAERNVGRRESRRLPGTYHPLRFKCRRSSSRWWRASSSSSRPSSSEDIGGGQSQEVVMARKAKRVRKAMIQRAGDRVSAEVVLSSESGSSMFETGAVLTANNLDRYKPPGGRGMEAARVLQEVGFMVRHIGTFSISVE